MPAMASLCIATSYKLIAIVHYTVSGQAPQHPVVSKKSGHLFERSLILKYIAENGRDPITGDSLTADDLVELRTDKTVKPKAPTATSVPNILVSLQAEWDSVVLETFQLKQQYSAVRQELSRALYENDAAKRVIARLAKERDEARAALANLKVTSGGAISNEETSTSHMDIDGSGEAEGLSEADINKMQEKATSLSKSRRKRKASPTLATVDQIKSYSKLNEVHGLSASNNGITSIGLIGSLPRWALAGSSDGEISLLDWGIGKMLDTAKAHTKRINAVVSSEEGDSHLFFTASSDMSVKSWRYKVEADGSAVIGASQWSYAHRGDVTSMDIHPTGAFLLAASADSTWSLADIGSGRVITKVATADFNDGYTSAAFHPDGLIVATGTAASTVRIWDIKSQTNVKTFDGHSGKITSIAFSENGYHLATAAEGDSVVKLWDLRNLSNFENLQIENASARGVQRVRFDYSGQYLAVACGKELRTYKAKSWNQIGSLGVHEQEVTDLRWDEDAKHLITGGMDSRVVVSGIPK
ncbi:hypothetical protein HK097_001023 [Rhizophlyctis rosea]|uniref:Pre-mRNA-processing factor 19 n=1 Tax=Rhizophlyctis rosea TaxID=64517 RepID=A0AAD5X542_9FUNG|nr:hypothetical protein HK097_001023 [Rhizophlyctis rosea]